MLYDIIIIFIITIIIITIIIITIIIIIIIIIITLTAGQKTGILSMAAAQMQRWSLVLFGYQYNIEYIPSTENINADMLNRLPVDKPVSASPDEITSVCMLTSQQIAEAARKDTTLAYDHILHGWPRSCTRDDKLYPFFV
ncbi:hypothetical protein LSH36_535g01006 [Paralvinella palmiformis]|uniref:Uncharacterized protein n=1 Tax=Paralvinella palmiformis TaxID=53620 RepID=A0AAD9MYL9_9ANNE|nr:hypothetical protein LSH36_535g01006 [Paralvinella palmiformis]